MNRRTALKTLLLGAAGIVVAVVADEVQGAAQSNKPQLKGINHPKSDMKSGIEDTEVPIIDVTNDLSVWTKKPSEDDLIYFAMGGKSEE